MEITRRALITFDFHLVGLGAEILAKDGRELVWRSRLYHLDRLILLDDVARVEI